MCSALGQKARRSVHAVKQGRRAIHPSTCTHSAQHRMVCAVAHATTTSSSIPGTRTIALEGLNGFVGHPLAVDGDSSQSNTLVLEQHLVTDSNVLAVGIKHDGQTKDKAILWEGHSVVVVWDRLYTADAVVRRTVMCMFSTTLLYSSSFIKPVRGEKPLC